MGTQILAKSLHSIVRESSWTTVEWMELWHVESRLLVLILHTHAYALDDLEYCCKTISIRK